MTSRAKNAARTRPAAPPAEDAGREAWALLVKLFQCGRASTLSGCAEFELSAAQANVLQTLDPAAEVPMSSLASTLACDASNVTGLVDKLESRGLVERRPDPKDRRVKMIALTASGRRLRDELATRLSTPPPAIESLSRADQEALLHILRKALGTCPNGS